MINLPEKPSTSLCQISLALVCGAFTGSISGAEGPSFPCDKVEAASGSRYQGRNETFWEHHGEATVTWGLEASSMVCRRAESR
jgi:hypothetical protein